MLYRLNKVTRCVQLVHYISIKSDHALPHKRSDLFNNKKKSALSLFNVYRLRVSMILRLNKVTMLTAEISQLLACLLLLYEAFKSRVTMLFLISKVTLLKAKTNQRLVYSFSVRVTFI